MYNNQMSLHGRDGQRKYLNQKERLKFFNVTRVQPKATRLFCQLLYYTGARISEIYNLRSDNIDLANGTVIIQTLKKRKSGIYREIPLPEELLIELYHYVKGHQVQKSIWPFSLRTASRQIKSVMRLAEIEGVRGCARGLRHGFAVHAVSKAPVTIVKKWLGHSRLETTEIYLDIIGAEEREIASRVWGMLA